MNNDAIKQLAKRFLKGEATTEEQQMLHDWYARNLEGDEAEVVILRDEEEAEQVKQRLYASVMMRLKADQDVEEVESKPRLWILSRYRIAVAAAAVLLISLGLWYFLAPRYTNPVTQYANDIKPGASRATLTLANGKKITLSESKAGVIIDSINIRYKDGSSVQSTDEPGAEPQMLNAATPRGGTYQVVLPDGTNVWLNAASEISFPSRFEGEERLVWLRGEAYFEVKKDAGRRFVVESTGQRIEVLGTHFNVNSYEDESSVRTTLMEGSVAAATKEERIVLEPGQQAISGTSGRIKVIAVNANDMIDWKNGDFVFRGENLETVMRKISRWYDVEVNYASEELKGITVGGFVSRSRSISAVLQLMERTGKLKFKITGRRVFVSK